MNDAGPNLVRKAVCSSCGGERNCDVRSHFSKSDTEYFGGNFSIDWTKDWYVLQCRGCEHIFVQTVATNSEDIVEGYDEQGNEYREWQETIEYWPAISRRERPTWLAEIDTAEHAALQASLHELYGALNADLKTLAGIGIRTTFDIASGILGIDEALPFAGKIEALAKYGHIGPHDKARLQTAIDGGSASAHRGWSPTAGQLATMMDILEGFLHETMVVPQQKKRLDGAASKLNVPPRKRRAPAEMSYDARDATFARDGEGDAG